MAASTGGSRRGGLDARDDGRHTGRTPAQWYCLLAGAALLLAGVTGFIVDATFDTAGGDTLQGDSLLGFEVNGWHNLVHIASGAVLLAAFGKRKPAKTVALAFGVVYGIVTVIGLIDGNDVLGIIPINGPDNILHLALAAVGIFAALTSPTDEHRGRHAGGTRDDRFSRTDSDALTGRTSGDRTTTRTR